MWHFVKDRYGMVFLSKNLSYSAKKVTAHSVPSNSSAYSTGCTQNALKSAFWRRKTRTFGKKRANQHLCN